MSLASARPRISSVVEPAAAGSGVTDPGYSPHRHVCTRFGSSWHDRNGCGARRPAGLCRKLRLAVLPLLPFVLAGHAGACAVCFGKTDTPVVQAANGAILFMLVVVAGVLGSFLGFIFYLVRRQGRPPADHEVLQRMIAGDERRLHEKGVD